MRIFLDHCAVITVLIICFYCRIKFSQLNYELEHYVVSLNCQCASHQHRFGWSRTGGLKACKVWSHTHIIFFSSCRFPSNLYTTFSFTRTTSESPFEAILRSFSYTLFGLINKWRACNFLMVCMTLYIFDIDSFPINICAFHAVLLYDNKFIGIMRICNKYWHWDIQVIYIIYLFMQDTAHSKMDAG